MKDTKAAQSRDLSLDHEGAEAPMQNSDFL